MSSPPPSEDPRRRDAVTRMTRAWRELRRGPSTIVLRDALYGTGPDAIEPTHMDVLDLLAEHDHRRMSDLAAALKVDPSTITRTLQRMEAGHLARRAQSLGDGRVVTVSMTDDGRRRHAAAAALRASVIATVLEAFSDDERRELVELNERFLAALDRAIGSLGPPPPVD